MKRIICAVLCIIMIFSACSCGKGKVLAQYEGGEITASMLKDAKKYINKQYPEKSDEEKEKLYWEYVEKYALMYAFELEIATGGISFDEEEFDKSMEAYKKAREKEYGDYQSYLDKFGVSEKFFYNEQRFMALSTAINEHVKNAVISGIPEEDAREYYHAHAENYAAGYSTTAEYIWFYVEIDATNEERKAIKALAEKTMADIKANGLTIEEAQQRAKAENPYGKIDIFVLENVESLKNSDAIDSVTGKPYYVLYNALFPEEFFDLKEGEFLPYVVETLVHANTDSPKTYGYNLVFVKGFEPVPERSFEEMRDEIKMILASNKYSEAMKEHREYIVEKYNISYNDEK